MVLIGLDLGTTGCKCTVFDTEGNTLGYGYSEYSTTPSPEGGVELDGRMVWEKVCGVIKKAASSCDMTDEASMSVSSFGEVMVPIDANGNILSGSIMNYDLRGLEQSRQLAAALGAEELYSRVGLPVHPMFSINKLMWIRTHQNELYKRAHKFLCFQDFVNFMLTGEAVIDLSMASRTMALNIINKDWDEAVLDAAGVSRAKLARPATGGTEVGIVKPELAQRLGLPKTRVFLGGIDQACASLGCGITEAGMATDGMGTLEVITAVYDKPILTPTMRRYNFNCAPFVIDGLYVTFAFTFSAGSLLKWFRDTLGYKELSEAEERGVNVYQVLDEHAPSEPTGLLALPHFSGSGTPSMDPLSQGLITGLNLQTTRGELYRGLVEGISYETKYNIDCLREAGIDLHTIRAVGGGARSGLWTSVKADILGMPLDIMSVEEAGTLGNAMIAGVASGIFSSYKQAVAKLVRVKGSIQPDMKNHEIYKDRYAKYLRVYEANKRILE